jgi:hypothetical protein
MRSAASRSGSCSLSSNSCRTAFACTSPRPRSLSHNVERSSGSSFATTITVRKIAASVYTPRLVRHLHGPRKRGVFGGHARSEELEQHLAPRQRPGVLAQWAQTLVELSELRGRAAGEAAGIAKAILAVLGARGIHVSGEARARIEACEDVSMLDR